MSESTNIPVTAAQHTCGCNEAEHNDPVLDARTIPHAVRHAAIFGALDSIDTGSSMILIAPHDPLPLLAQATARYSTIGIEYVQSGPDAWHVRLTR